MVRGFDEAASVGQAQLGAQMPGPRDVSKRLDQPKPNVEPRFINASLLIYGGGPGFSSSSLLEGNPPPILISRGVIKPGSRLAKSPKEPPHDSNLFNQDRLAVASPKWWLVNSQLMGSSCGSRNVSRAFRKPTSQVWGVPNGLIVAPCRILDHADSTNWYPQTHTHTHREPYVGLVGLDGLDLRPLDVFILVSHLDQP